MSRGGVFLSAAIVFFGAFFFCRWPLQAQEDPFPTGPEAGRKLAAKLLTVKPAGDDSWRGVIKIFGRERKVMPVPISSELKMGETNWTVTYVTAPADTNLAESFTIIFCTNGPNRYFFGRADKPGAPPGEPREISGAEADIPIGGSDFWLSDLGLEFLHWPDQTRMRGDIRSSRGRYVLVSRNPHPHPGGYSSVKVFIDKETDQPTQAEAFGVEDTNKTVKSFSLEKLARKPDGSYEVKELLIVGKGNFRSRLEINAEADKNKK
jgi:hypothetical protein